MRVIFAALAAMAVAGCSEEAADAFADGLDTMTTSRAPAPMYMPVGGVVSQTVQPVRPVAAPVTSGPSPFIQSAPANVSCVRTGNVTNCHRF